MLHRKLAVIPAVLIIAGVPALAVANPPSGKTPGPKSSEHAKAKAYGKLCQAEPKKHVKGMKGTPFSQCVTAMAKLAHDTKMAPKQACKAESKKHVKGMKGTPFSQCIKAAAQMHKTPAVTPTPTSTGTETPTPTAST
jgi:hypothetical protein